MKWMYALGLSLIATSVFADTDKWKKIDTEQEYHVYLDTDRIKKDYPTKGNVQAWLKFVVHTDLTPDQLSLDDYKIVRYEFNCKDTTRAISALYLYQSKQLIHSDEIKELAYKPVVPDSTGEYNLNQVCQHVYKK